MHQRAVTRLNDGDYEGASRLLDEARGLAVNPDESARIDLTAAYIQAQTGTVRDSFAELPRPVGRLG